MFKAQSMKTSVSITLSFLMILSCLIFVPNQVRGNNPYPKSRWNDARAMERQAGELYRKGDYDGALALRRKLVEEYQDVVYFAANAQISIGSHFKRIGQYDRAAKEYEKVITMFPEDRHFHLLALTVMAELYEKKLHDLQKALEIYKRIIREYREGDDIEGDELYSGAEMKIQWIQDKVGQRKQ